ncbi:hypothetical protein HWV62_4447 [Athelia sp. TMB]|nr:hypothetical protein HWV62_4447 [Athelia sp. TMB]
MVTPTSRPTSFLGAAGSANATVSSQRCDNIDNCRNLDGIVQSCLVTILACVWFAVHRNIPAPRPKTSPELDSSIRIWTTLWRTVRDQKVSLIVFLVALFLPELILGWAVRQLVLARKLARKLEKARLNAIEARTGEVDDAEITERLEGQLSPGTPTTPTSTEFERMLSTNRRSQSHVPCDKCDGRGSQFDLFVAAKRIANADERWTVSHAFFVAMGGFEFYNEDGPLYPLSPANVLELVARDHIVPPTAHEISDRSKGDWLTKGVAIGQTVWFVVQCIARRATGLPVTSLEVMTLAYTVITVAMYAAWWHKPLNVSCAIRVPEEEVKEEEVFTCTSRWEKIGIYMVGWQDSYVDLRERKGLGVPIFWAGRPSINDGVVADLAVISVAMTFGAVHCVAWYSDFQSHLEQKLWRWSSIAIIAAPGALGAIGYTVLVSAFVAMRRLMPQPDPGSAYRTAGNQSAYFSARRAYAKAVNMFLLGIVFTPIIVIYIAARIILIVLSFTSLRGLPFAAYQTVQWTTFMPHI